MGDFDRALSAYEAALRHNPHSVAGLTQVAGIARIRENYTKVRLSLAGHSLVALAAEFAHPGRGRGALRAKAIRRALSPIQAAVADRYDFVLPH